MQKARVKRVTIAFLLKTIRAAAVDTNNTAKVMTQACVGNSSKVQAVIHLNEPKYFICFG
jgi:hypothetical protein